MSEWRTIDSAPRDGTEFLVIGSLRAIVVASFEPAPTHSGIGKRKRVLVESFRKEVLYGQEAWATHWMPLSPRPRSHDRYQPS